MGLKKSDIPTDEEVKRMHDYLRKRYLAKKRFDSDGDEYKQALTEYLLFLLLVTTGRRIGEILSIRVKDVDFNEKIIWTIIEKVKRRDLTLGEKLVLGLAERRPISITTEVAELIKEYIEVNKLPPHARLFGYTDRWAQLTVKKWATAVGITDKNITPHSFRHYLVTTLRRKGWTFEDIAKVTGHKSIKSLEAVYDHTTFNDVRDRFDSVQRSLLDEIMFK